MLNIIILLNSSNSINYFVKIQLITYMYILKIWVSNVDGLSKNGFVGSEETNNMSYIDNAAISHIKVVSTPLVRFLSLTSDNMESRIFLVVLIIRCQTPPIWEECGGLESQTVPVSNRNFLITES